MLRIVDIETDARHLCVKRGHLVVQDHGHEVGRVPLDDIAAVIVHAHGCTMSNHVNVALVERGAVIVSCNSSHAPVAMTVGLVGHHVQTARMIAQAEASRPLKKRIWQALVQAKIGMQGRALEVIGETGSSLQFMSERVKSGDPDNVEAQAARRYWPMMMGQAFRRDQNGAGVNGLLNYGYAILRALCARSVVASGLIPALGVHHHNRQNPFALVDDVMEPFRPVIDLQVRRLVGEGVREVDRGAKQKLASITNLDLTHADGVTPLNLIVERLVSSLAQSFLQGRNCLEIPVRINPAGAELVESDE